jgi:hypothetical protein
MPRFRQTIATTTAPVRPRLNAIHQVLANSGFLNLSEASTILSPLIRGFFFNV